MAARSEAARFTRRQWGHRLQAARPWLLALAAVGAVALGAWALLFSSWLATQRVEVAGNDMVATREVVKAAGIQDGTPLLRVNLDSVREQVAALPSVASVSVHRGWPHTIDITVTERVPLATVLSHGQWYAMDKTGVLFHAQAFRDAALPIVVLALGADPAARAEVASVVSALPHDMLSTMRRVKARSMDSITLVLSDGRHVVWGNADESSRKVEVLAVLLKQRAAVYDVSVPEEPTTRR